MSEVLATNSAERALNFITDFSNFSRQVNQTDTSAQVRQILAIMYEVDTHDTSSLMRVLSDAWRLPVQIRQDVRSIGLNPIAFEPAMKELEKVLTSMMLNANARDARVNIPAGLAASLGMISSILTKDSPEPLLSREKIDELLKEVDDFEDDVRSADLDNKFTDYILHRADGIRYALSHYETLGPDEVMAKVDQMFGGVLRQYQTLTKPKKASGFVSRLLNIGASIVLAINAVNGGFELSDNITDLIDVGIQHEADVVNEPKLESKISSE